jgi:hypothetical protein
MKNNRNIKEDAACGAVGAGAVAAAPTRLSKQMKRVTLKSFLTATLKVRKKKLMLKPAIIREFYDLSDVVSRLKSVEDSDTQRSDTTVYGVEDDDGNIMKVSVKANQAKEFEVELAQAMADANENKEASGQNVASTSLAELLYKLKEKFNIVDVEFPTIPKDVIYQADKATYGPATSTEQPHDDLEGDDPMASDSDSMGDSMGDLGDDADLDVDGGDTSGLEGAGDESDEDALVDGDDELTDHESVEDFGEEQQSSTPESLLQAVMDMLKADAAAKKAQADAAAEEARAKQAEFAYRSAQATVSREEEYARMEMEMDAQKAKEKDAKRLADMAKYRVQKANNVQESSNSLLRQVIMELDNFDTVQSLMRQKASLRQKYQVQPADTLAVRQYKQNLLRLALRELNTKIDAARARDTFLGSQQRTNPQAQPPQDTSPGQNPNQDRGQNLIGSDTSNLGF